ncbi:integrase arm-type DNA-binding domain-containing protein, partial [Caballeronia mineralivorans]|uniref:integrase arm-type DNA-binding domain-containing protein n=1 Tax=Caballeronia mineralivorans TaxID=2010198 RepID=UPI000A706C04
MPRYVEPKSELAFRNAKTGPKPYLLSDGQSLSLRIRPNGAKTWLLRYRRSGTGKENFLSLGPYPDVTLTEARRRAATARDLVRESSDPVEQRRADVAARKRAADGAFHLVAKAWLEFKRKEWADETYRKAEFVLREYLTPALRNKSISTLSTAQVKPVLETIAAKAPNLASKARQYCWRYRQLRHPQ